MKKFILFVIVITIHVSGFSKINGNEYKVNDTIIASEISIIYTTKKEEDINKVYTEVETKAEFPGGINGWIKYLERNINRDLPYKNGAPPGRYTVLLSFVVAKDGTISEIKAETDPGYGSKEEAIRLMAKSPKWKPAFQNGRNVFYRHKQSITFLVN